MNHERLELRFKEHVNGFTVWIERDFHIERDEIIEQRIEGLRILERFIQDEIIKELEAMYEPSKSV